MEADKNIGKTQDRVSGGWNISPVKVLQNDRAALRASLGRNATPQSLLKTLSRISVTHLIANHN